MFFSPDLLERRDSGYGLLWLAATLGAKSSFRKLPKRSVLTADISQLCSLIAEPPEPLALRLSSNLMIGVARVYKVKQEIFIADVTNCFNTLKKAVQDLSALTANATQLQMGQPSLRVEALTLVADPGTAFGIDFDGIFATWDELIEEEESDAEYDPKTKKPNAKGKRKQKNAPSSAIGEYARVLHTLEEDHDHLLAAAFDGSLSGSGQGGAGFDPSSSQIDGEFGLDNDLFAIPDVNGVADIGDELARELGEGWGGSALQSRLDEHRLPDGSQGDGGLELDIDAVLGDDFRFDVNQDDSMQPQGATRGSRAESVIVPLAPFSPHGLDIHSEHGANVGTDGQAGKPVPRRAKRVRLLLDARIELTDEELKMARANYVEDQEALKRSLAQKKTEKESSKLIEEMIYGAPRGVEAPILVDFWLENFRLQVGARSGELHMELEGEPPRKRHRVEAPFTGEGRNISPPAQEFFGTNIGQDTDFDMRYEGYPYTGGDDINIDSRLRSSEEPGQARRGSRPPSALGSHLEFDLRPTQDIISGSQRSALFPWDHAGPSSSVGGAPFGMDGSDVFSALRPNSKRGSSLGSRRESFLPGAGIVPDSPLDFGLKGSQIDANDFQFNVPDEEAQLQEESQQSNALALERNSSNFLEYAKMQLMAFPSTMAELAFDDVVPKTTSTRRVAAAAFYHCLVLSTKNLMSVSQDGPYGVLKIRVK